MATDEVRIILRGSSKELEAAIARIGTGLKRLQTQSVTTNRVMQTGAQKTSKSINQQNKSFTLMVAKLALVAFAVQTVANIVNSTFGAMLKNIDEFQVAAIGTASAVTAISTSTKPIGEIFTNNLEAARAAFEALDIVAADFFSTGAELQLAFNTLAQRGVIVREDEFRILGKLTDQIKLLTGGQNTQIQIQQELRAILDGNIRTTTAFAKSLQARGVDVRQLSKEVRATGSLKPFEPFLTGLDAASGAIRRTLSSVTATFGSLFNILQRNIFQDTFDNAVSTITSINNLMIDQRDLIIQMGILIKNEISGAWNVVLDVLDLMSATFIRLIKNDLVQFVSAFALAGKLIKRGPLGAILGVSTALTGVTGEAGTFGDVTSISFDLLAIGIDKLVKGLDGVINVFKELGELITAFGAGGFSLTFQVKNLQQAETTLNDLGKDLEETNRQIQFLGKIPERNLGQQDRLSNALTRQLRLMREITTASKKVEAAQANIADSGSEGQEFLAGRTSNLTTDLRKSISGAIGTVAELTDEAASSLLKNTKEEAEGALESFAALAANIKIPERGDAAFEDTLVPVEIDRVRIVRQLKEQEALIEVSRTRQLQQQRTAVSIAQAEAQRDFDSRLITGREFFARQQQLRREDLVNQQRVTQERLESVQTLAKREIALIELQAKQRATEALPAAQRARTARIDTLQDDKSRTAKENEELQKLLATRVTIASLIRLTDDEEIESTRIQNAERQKTIKLLGLILKLKTSGTTADEKALGVLEKQNRITQQSLARRDRDIEAFGGQTNAERATQINAESSLRQQAFNQTNVDPAQQARFAGQERLIRIQKAIENQVEAITGAIEAAFDAVIDGIVEGSFEFRDLAQTVSKDLIKSGLDGLIKEIQSAVSEGMQKLFEGAGVAGAQKAAQALTLALGLVLAIISRVGNKGEFTASEGGGGGIDSSSVPTRGLIGGDTSLPIAQINNGLMEALIPTNAILSQIEFNTRALADLNLGIDPNALSQAITAQVQSLFSQAALQV